MTNIVNDVHYSTNPTYSLTTGLIVNDVHQATTPNYSLTTGLVVNSVHYLTSPYGSFSCTFLYPTTTEKPFAEMVSSNIVFNELFSISMGSGTTSTRPATGQFWPRGIK